MTLRRKAAKQSSAEPSRLRTSDSSSCFEEARKQERFQTRRPGPRPGSRSKRRGSEEERRGSERAERRRAAESGAAAAAGRLGLGRERAIAILGSSRSLLTSLESQREAKDSWGTGSGGDKTKRK